MAQHAPVSTQPPTADEQPRRRAMDQSPSGGLVFTATAARMLGLSVNGLRDVVARGHLTPFLSIENGASPGRVALYQRHEVEAYGQRMALRAQARERIDVGLGLKRPQRQQAREEQLLIGPAGDTLRGGW